MGRAVVRGLRAPCTPLARFRRGRLALPHFRPAHHISRSVTQCNPGTLHQCSNTTFSSTSHPPPSSTPLRGWPGNWSALWNTPRHLRNLCVGYTPLPRLFWALDRMNVHLHSFPRAADQHVASSQATAGLVWHGTRCQRTFSSLWPSRKVRRWQDALSCFVVEH